jgi:hypothetical protein
LHAEVAAVPQPGRRAARAAVRIIGLGTRVPMAKDATGSLIQEILMSKLAA